MYTYVHIHSVQNNIVDTLSGCYYKVCMDTSIFVQIFYYNISLSYYPFSTLIHLKDHPDIMSMQFC